jgi:hypothetical protein
MVFSRLSEVLASAVSVGVHEASPQDLSADVPQDVPLLWMTGSVDPKLDASRRQRLKAHLQAGGMLFIDAANGGKEFADAAATMLTEMFGSGSVKPLPESSPLLTGDFAGGMGADVRKVAYNRAAAAEQPKPDAPVLSCVVLDGRVAAVLSPYGVACPAEGNPAFSCRGLSTPDARRLAANVILYAAWQKASSAGR